MDKKSILKIIVQFKKALERKGVKVSQLILFGSWANNTPREDSDIDLVVVSKDFEGKNFWERIDLISEAIYEVFAPIEAIALTPPEWDKGDSLICTYVKKGELLSV